jgi:hypothetical protein
MDVIVPSAVLAAVVSLTSAPALRGRRGPPADQPREEPGVTLAMLPGRRAVVTLQAEGGRVSPADLVDLAVREAFRFDGVGAVEVRRADGALIERRLRPTPAWPA